MRFLIASLLLSATALGQTPAKMITFNRADAEHCKVVVVSGRPPLESTYDGTSVAIGMPVNRGNEEFSVFVAVSQSGPSSVQVNPKDFYALYPDPIAGWIKLRQAKGTKLVIRPTDMLDEIDIPVNGIVFRF